jgi:hypothetical protein
MIMFLPRAAVTAAISAEAAEKMLLVSGGGAAEWAGV